MDPTRPAEVDPLEIAEPVKRFGVTMMFGSPALLNTVGRWAEANGTQLPSLRRVIAAGAPLPGPTIRRWEGILNEDARVFPPYGATESLPIACLPSDEIVNDTWPQTERGKGVCVGRAVDTIEVRIIEITDEPIARWSDATPVSEGDIGEICVRGDMVTGAYFGDERHTRLSKIDDENGGRWHRMGDVGWRDEQGRIWFCGRKAHRVVLDDRTLFTVPLEKVFDTHPAVFRSALVGARLGGATTPVLCVELEPGAQIDLPSLEAELRERGQVHPDGDRIQRMLVHDGFPVDIRHNAKIGREKLARWAESELSGGATS
jgi:acyl-CoA synthetase (AMP-forming)/AMP-acid ligase II